MLVVPCWINKTIMVTVQQYWLLWQLYLVRLLKGHLLILLVSINTYYVLLNTYIIHTHYLYVLSRFSTIHQFTQLIIILATVLLLAMFHSFPQLAIVVHLLSSIARIIIHTSLDRESPEDQGSTHALCSLLRSKLTQLEQLSSFWLKNFIALFHPETPTTIIVQTLRAL